MSSRYRWKSNGRTYNLWFPKAVAGKDRRTFLEKNIIPRPNHQAPWAEQRIQAVIDNHYGVPRMTSLDGKLEESVDDPAPMPSPCEAAVASERPKIRQAIVEEKVGLIHTMRRKIREFGPSKFGDFVSTILVSLEDRCESHASIAKRYGISPSTFSRFAGHIKKRKDGGYDTPDLWFNMARIAARDSAFVDAAQDVGLFKAILKTERGEKGPVSRITEE